MLKDTIVLAIFAEYEQQTITLELDSHSVFCRRVSIRAHSYSIGYYVQKIGRKQ